MNNIKYIITFLLAFVFIFNACEPELKDKPGYDDPPSADQLSFEIAQGADEYTFELKNTSAIKGIVHWDLGNGIKTTGDDISVTYNFPGEFEITLTIVTNGGQASVSQTLVQDATNYSLLTDPVYINLSGGTDAINGKTWVLDSLSSGHIGMGSSDADWANWWNAGEREKWESGAIYDDELNFNIVDFIVTYATHGSVFVNTFRPDDPAYSNAYEVAGGFNVDYPGPVSGTWSINTVEDVNYLVFHSSTPIFPMFDNGAVGASYTIQSISENEMKLRCIGSDGNAWYYILIPKGYVRPVIEYDFSITATANPNEYQMQITDLVIPASVAITNITWDFNDPRTEAYETTDENEVVTYTYMEAGTYNVTVTIEDTDGNVFTQSQELVVENNHPTYIPYVEQGMSMYANFDNLFRPVFIDNSDGSGTFKIVANPLINFDNESENVVLFTKISAQWTNLNMPLSDAYRFDFSQSTKFKLKVYGNAGDVVLLKVENTDLGGDAWTTGAESTYTIQENNTWEIAEFDFSGVATAQGQSSDITTDPAFSSGYYNIVRIMINAGDNSATFSFYLDDLAGPLVPGWKK